MTTPNFSSLLLLLPLAIVCSTSRANSIDISSGPASWTVSIPVEGVSNAAPFSGGITDGVNLCISSSCNSAGTWAGGGSLAGFDGFWTAQLTFMIPSGATGVSLAYTNFNADDRAVLELNGTTFASGPGTGVGDMVLTDGGPDNPYTFLGNTSGTITSGLNIGGSNTIEVILNNTGNGIHGAPSNVSGGDYTYLSFTGTVSYTAATSAPEPGSLALAGGGLLYCIARFRRRSRMR